MHSYPWYKELENKDLEQGDLIENCPIITPPQNKENFDNGELEVKEYNVVILTQSCDLAAGKVENVIVCPYYELNSNSDFKKNAENIRKGNIIGYHLLNKIEINQMKSDYLVVDFRNTFSVSLLYLKEHVKELEKRYRLLPPYREHLSQSFARFFMRVGLPSDIKFEK